MNPQTAGRRAEDDRPGRLRAAWAACDAAAGYRRIPGTGVAALGAMLIGLAIGVVTLATGAAPTVDPAALGVGPTSVTVGARPTDGWLPAPRILLTAVSAVVGHHLAVPALGAACLAAAAAALYRITVQVSLGRGGRLAALVVLVAAPTTLYQLATTATGPVLLAAVLATVAGLARWARVRRTPSGGELAIFAGVPCTVAVLTRYEGWVLLLAGAVFVLLVARQKSRGARSAARMLASFLVIPVIGVSWWLAYDYSTRGAAFAGTGSIGAALGLPGWAVTEAPPHGMLRSLTESLPAATTGATAIVVALLGAAAAVLRYRWSDRLWVVGLLVATAAVDVASVAAAVTAGEGGAGWVGRFALPAVPAMALLSGLAVDVARRAARTGPATAILPSPTVALLGGAAPSLSVHRAAAPAAGETPTETP